jgi:hypothetical protein
LFHYQRKVPTHTNTMTWKLSLWDGVQLVMTKDRQLIYEIFIKSIKSVFIYFQPQELQVPL